MLRTIPLFFAATFLSFTGCSSPKSASRSILAHWAELAHADWLYEMEKGQDSYYSVQVFEDELIAHGQAADAEAMKMLRNFDHRVRCSGLTVIIGIRGLDGAKDVLVEHLTDPYEPIRWRCWHQLHDLRAVDLDSMPARRDFLGQWKRLKLQLLEDMGKDVRDEGT